MKMKISVPYESVVVVPCNVACTISTIMQWKNFRYLWTCGVKESPLIEDGKELVCGLRARDFIYTPQRDCFLSGEKLTSKFILIEYNRVTDKSPHVSHSSNANLMVKTLDMIYWKVSFPWDVSETQNWSRSWEEEGTFICHINLYHSFTLWLMKLSTKRSNVDIVFPNVMYWCSYNDAYISTTTYEYKNCRLVSGGNIATDMDRWMLSYKSCTIIRTFIYLMLSFG